MSRSPGPHLLLSRVYPALQPVMRRTEIAIWEEPSVSPRFSDAVIAWARHLPASVEHDFGMPPARLRIDVYSTHRSFARALWRQQRQRPQTVTDNLASIVHSTLLLGPLPHSYLRHNLTHVYAEWVMDRLSGNASDTLPPNPWLYDGLAEYEAYRYAPAGMPCAAAIHPPFDVTSLRTADEWMALRAGPLSSLEYCLAYLRVKKLIAHVGWRCMVRTLSRRIIWTAATELFLDRPAGSACGARYHVVAR